MGPSNGIERNWRESGSFSLTSGRCPSLRDIGDVEKDEEGIRTMKTLGQNMAWLLKRIGA